MSLIIWFRRDLRLDDNLALLAGVARKEPLIPVYIHDPAADEGAATRWWLGESLKALDSSLRELGSRLIVRSGEPCSQLKTLAAETGAEAIFWNRRYEPASIAGDAAIESALVKNRVAVETFSGHLLFEGHEIRNKTNAPYRVFTPFWRACLKAKTIEAPASKPKAILAPKRWPASLEIASLGLKPTIPWDSGMISAWTPGEAGALQHLKTFKKHGVADYLVQRDIPSVSGTSRLSPHLAFGEISPRRIWASFSGTRPAVRAGESKDEGAAFLRQIAWREFAYHLLQAFPQTIAKPLRPEFENFPWEDDPALLRAWQRGRTGFPIVDAGMRELWATGWMHNRVRMIVGSFLVKDLLLPWQSGAAWFWDTLVDADLANNTLGWQWISGCGADAAPYFRVFNPQSQAERYDPSGAYIKKWIPELQKLPNEWIHQPSAAPAAALKKAGIVLDKDYPRPVVDHGEARLRALIAYEKVKRSRK